MEKSNAWAPALAMVHRMACSALEVDVVATCAATSACAGSSQWAFAVLLARTGWETCRSVVALNAALSACERARRWERAMLLLGLASASFTRLTMISYNGTRKGLRASLVTMNAVVSSSEGSWELSLQLLQPAKCKDCVDPPFGAVPSLVLKLAFVPDLVSYNAAISAQAQGI
ncbi:unnamed protein product [Effrenium voratum]|nr:unnamed protein product [Effrenium voratum]